MYDLIGDIHGHADELDGGGASKSKVVRDAGLSTYIHISIIVPGSHSASAEAVYVLHAFQKRTRATAKRDVELARLRYSELTRGER